MVAHEFAGNPCTTLQRFAQPLSLRRDILRMAGVQGDDRHITPEIDGKLTPVCHPMEEAVEVGSLGPGRSIRRAEGGTFYLVIADHRNHRDEAAIRCDRTLVP